MAPPFAQKTSRFSQMRADASRARTTKADIARDLDREITRKTYFDNRPDISDDRLDRRRKQAEGIASFKEKFTKPVNIVDSEGNVTGVVKGLTQAKDATVFDSLIQAGL